MGDAALRTGLKPTQFNVGPIDPLAQAKLFLRRVGRPLYVWEVFGKSVDASADGAEIFKCKNLSELLRLAETPKIRALNGNLVQLVAFAQSTSLAQPFSGA